MEYFSLSDHTAHALETVMHLALAFVYGIAFWACRKHGHPPYQTYCASCMIYVALSAVLLMAST